MRVKAAKLTKTTRQIEWRSHEPSRLETFSDAVFAFAITLVVISIEVPKTYVELLETIKGTISFAACFAVLFTLWNNQNVFFRCYGLNDRLTVTLNAFLLFMVLVYVYPLKFLFNLVFSGNEYIANGLVKHMIVDSDVPMVMLIYGAGYAIINLLFCLMYTNALRQRSELHLTAPEVFETKTTAYIYVICSLIGVVDIILSFTLPNAYASYSGMLYMVIGPAYFIWYSYRGRIKRKRFETTV